MSDNPDGLDASLAALFAWWSVPVTPEAKKEPKIKKEVVSENDIRVLLGELETPAAEVEKNVTKIQAILELTETDIEKNIHPGIRKMVALTEWRAHFLPRFASLPMIYRDYVGLHSRRLQFLILFNSDLLKEIFGEEFNDHYATLYADVHDILEWISPFWDIATPIKDWLSKKSDEIKDLVERKLWEIFIYSLPLVHWEHEYDRQMLEDMIDKETLESQVVSYFDKLDGFLACFHEIIAGNSKFREPFANYINIFKGIRDGKKLPALQTYLQWKWNESHWDLALLNQIDDLIAQWDRIDDIFWKCDSTELMKENIENDFWFHMYRVWKSFVHILSAYDRKGTISWEDLLTKRYRVLIPPEWLYDEVIIW